MFETENWRDRDALFAGDLKLTKSVPVSTADAVEESFRARWLDVVYTMTSIAPDESRGNALY